MNYFYIPSRFSEENLVVSNQMGELSSKDFVVDRSGIHNNLFLYVRCGIYYVEQYGELHTLHAGEGVFMKLSDAHRYYSDKEQVADCVWMHLRGNMLQGILSRLDEYHKLPIIIQDQNLGDALDRCMKIVMEKADGYEYVLSSKLYEMFINVSAPILHEIEANTIHIHSWFTKEIDGYIERCIYTKIKLEDLARVVRMDKFYFIKQFQKYYKTTPMQYVSQKKVEVAMKLLENREASVKGVSHALCFSDQSYFNKVFKQYVGISPLSYKKSIQESKL